MNPWFVWTAVANTARLSTVLQILIYLPLTLATLSTPAFLLLSLLSCIQSFIHGTLLLFWGAGQALSVMQMPIHPILLLTCFHAFSSTVHPYLATATSVWGVFLRAFGPMAIILEGMSSLLVSQKVGQVGKQLVGEGEGYQFALLIAAAVGYVTSAWVIVIAYPAAASSPLSSTMIGVALTSFVFLTIIGFALRRTNIIESSALALFISYNIWLCGFDQTSFSDPSSSYAPLIPNIVPHLQTLVNFITNTLPKPVLVALLYRLAILHFASQILPTIGADSWESEDGVDDGWDGRPTSALTRIIYHYRQLIFIMVYSHLLLLDHSSQIWWRFMNIGFTLVMWSIELLVSGDGEDDSTKWKID